MTSDSGFWDDTKKAQEISQELSDLQSDVTFFDRVSGELREHAELLSLMEEEKDKKERAGLVSELDAIEVEIASQEHALRFDGVHDKNNAIITIQAGAGGTDAQDWAEMLERMYLRFAEREKWQVVSLVRSPGEEAGIKHTTFEVKGKYAHGVLRGEHGVHRLVRQSPFNSDSLRQTSFARVEVMPSIPPKDMPVIDSSDLDIQTFRASGAGGQHVNKTDSAVRIKHIPTGIVTQCQNQRSQHQNKEYAMAHLLSKLQVLAEEQHVENMKELRGEIKEATWGNQIRSYVLHPYKQVKDHRSNVEVSDVESVLDGNLSPFL